MSDVSTFDQWATARPLIQGYPQWVGGEDQARIAAYQLYEELYWNVPTAYKLIQRGSDNKPIYIPAAKTIIDTMHRYLAPQMVFIADPSLGTPADQVAATVWMSAFARRERVASKFNSAKRFGLIRGDWCFVVRGDESREPGTRVSIVEIDPGSYFPILDEDDLDTVVGQHIVEQIKDDDGKPAIKRVTYRKETGTGGPSPITWEEAVFEVDAWGGPDMAEKVKRVIQAPTVLPSPIDQLPVYHIPNFMQTGAQWGSSELRGMERLLAAINQSISDEELELVLNGLGVYVTDAGAPVDENGEETSWNLGPARVVEIGAGKKFERADGTKSVTPMQDHLKYLHEQLSLGTGTPDIAAGQVDVAVAESGIARALKFAPIFARAEEKELVISDKTNNMLFDLSNWFDAFEGESFGDAKWVVGYGDRIPQDKQASFDNLMKMAAIPGLVSAEWLRDELTKIGFVFPDAATLTNQILEEKMAFGQADADIIGARIDAELGGGGQGGGATGAAGQ